MGVMKADCSLANGCLAVITGGNRGIGLEIVRRLCEELGEKSRVIMCIRNKDQGEAALSTLHEAGHRQVEIYYPLEVTNEDQVKALAKFVKEQGGCDILINNAGMGMHVQMHAYLSLRTIPRFACMHTQKET
jgi:NAD(P)-dependent dehydrogenase (short-subunit alcohol dehydrogenase family)